MTTTLLITGGATGLGKSIALMWASQQKSAVNICIADINQERGDATVAEIKNLGATTIIFDCIFYNNITAYFFHSDLIIAYFLDLIIYLF